MKRFFTAVVFGLIAAVGLSATDGPLTNFLNLRGRTDENGYVMAVLGTPGLTDGPLTAFSNLRARVDSSGYLIVNCSGCAATSSFGTGVATFLATPTSANLAAAVTNETGSGVLVFATSPTLVTPVLGVATGTSLFNTVAGIGSVDFATADDAFWLNNSTLATVGTTLQASPNIRFTAHGWISGAEHRSDMVIALQPAITNFSATGAETGRPGHTLYFYSTTDNGTPFEAMRLQGNGNLFTRSSFDVAYNNSDVGDISLSAGGAIYWRGAGETSPTRVAMTSPARGLLRLYENAATPAHVIEINMGGSSAVTGSTNCTIAAGSTPSVGALTTASVPATCTVTYNTAFTGIPIVNIWNAGTGVGAPLTASSASAFTFTAGSNASWYWQILGII